MDSTRSSEDGAAAPSPTTRQCVDALFRVLGEQIQEASRPAMSFATIGARGRALHALDAARADAAAMFASLDAEARG